MSVSAPSSSSPSSPVRSRSRALGAAILAATLLAAAPTSANSGPPVELGLPVLWGEGCPPETASANLSPDGGELSVLFDEFEARAGGDSGRRHDRRTCNLELPLRVPPGTQVALARVDYRGFQSAPATAQTQVGVTYSFNSRPGPRFVRRFVGPMDEDFLVTQELSIRDAGAWSGCGLPVTLRLTASVLTTTNGRNELSIAQIDSADLAGGVSYELAYRPCGRGTPLPPPGRPPRDVPGGGPSRPGPPPRR